MIQRNLKFEVVLWFILQIRDLEELDFYLAFYSFFFAFTLLVYSTSEICLPHVFYLLV